MRWLVAVLLTVLVVAAAPSAEAARKALVIGNAAYAVRPLANPVNDAADIAARLEGLGFAVTVAKDTTRRQMAAAILAFQRALTPGDEAVVFYPGHGMQVRGQNWLLPVDADPQSEAEVEYEAIGVDSLLRGIGEARPRTALVLLDACRDNPFEQRLRSGGSRGLARVEEAASGTLVSYAAKPGTVAADGRGRNSPYTAAWLAALAEPGLTHHQILDRVHAAVMRETGDKQETWEEGRLAGTLVLNVAEPAPAATPAPTAVAAAPAPLPAFDPRIAELRFWESVERGGKEADYRAYLTQYPQGQFAALAQARLADLKPVPAPAPAPLSAPASVPASAAIERLDKMMVARTTANVRARPATAAERVSMLEEGGLAAVTGKSPDGDWLRIDVAGGSGWVHASLLGDLPAVAAAQPPAAAPLPARPPGQTAPGTRFRDCADCPEMISIPPGEFMRGSPGEQSKVRIPAPLAVGVHEVTFVEWDACVVAGGCNDYRPGDEGWGRGTKPVINVRWDDAKAYVAWLSRKTGQRYRLLSESEWEYAARAGTTTRFSCGDDEACLQSVAWYNGNAGGRTRPVGGLRANAFGLHDVHGNVWEWVEDCGNGDYTKAPVDGAAWTARSCPHRVARGGDAVSSDPRDLQSASRAKADIGYRSEVIGFRVARQP